MLRTSLKNLLIASTALVLALGVVACSDDNDDAGPATPTPSEPTAGSDTPTPTPGAQGVPIDTPTDSRPDPAGGSGTAPPGIPDFEQPPVTTVSANGQTVETGIGTFCWTMLCVDKIGVPTKGTLTVSTGDTVTVAIPQAAPSLREAAATVFEATQPQLLDDGSEIWPYPGAPGDAIASQVSNDTVEVTVDLVPGRYVLSVGMYFEQGDVIYGVLLDVQ